MPQAARKIEKNKDKVKDNFRLISLIFRERSEQETNILRTRECGAREIKEIKENY